jgi:hypothetical protein
VGQKREVPLAVGEQVGAVACRRRKWSITVYKRSINSGMSSRREQRKDVVKG